jgi:hypothetical protein
MDNIDNDHATNIGIIVLRLAEHDPGRWGDCSFPHGIVSVIDRFETAGDLVRELARKMSVKEVALAANWIREEKRCDAEALREFEAERAKWAKEDNHDFSDGVPF